MFIHSATQTSASIDSCVTSGPLLHFVEFGPSPAAVGYLSCCKVQELLLFVAFVVRCSRAVVAALSVSRVEARGLLHCIGCNHCAIFQAQLANQHLVLPTQGEGVCNSDTHLLQYGRCELRRPGIIRYSRDLPVYLQYYHTHGAHWASQWCASGVGNAAANCCKISCCGLGLPVTSAIPVAVAEWHVKSTYLDTGLAVLVASAAC